MSLSRGLLVAAALLVFGLVAAPALGAGLIKRAGPSGCFGAKPGCRMLLGRTPLRGHAMSPDGRTLYASAGGDSEEGGNLIVPLRVRRDLTLALPGRGCRKGRGGCARLGGGLRVKDMRVSDDGRSLYVAARNRLLVFHPEANGKLRSPAQVAAIVPA